MILLLSFLLSWLCGLFVIYVLAFISYEEFNIIDITSFAVLTLAGSLVVIIIFYQIFLKGLFKWMNKINLFIHYSVIFTHIAFIPLYIVIWQKAGNLYGTEEAKLFTICSAITATVFGSCIVWKNRMLKKE